MAALMLGAAQAATTVGLNFQSYYYDSSTTPQTIGFGAGYQTTGAPVTARAFGVDVSDWTNSDPLPSWGFTADVPFAGSLNAHVVASNMWQSGLTSPGTWGLAPGQTWWDNWADGATVLAAITPGNYQVTWSYLDNTGWTVDLTGLNAEFPNGYVLGLVGGNKTSTTTRVTITEDAGSTTVATVAFTVLPDNLGLGTSPALYNDGITLTNLSRDDSDTNGSLAGIIITDKPVVTQDPTGGTFATGSTLTLKATSIGLPTGLYYQWRQNGSAIFGANSPTYTKAGITAADNGTYDLVVTNSYGSTTSAAATVTVSQNSWNPPLTSAGDTDVVTAGTTVFAYDWNNSATAVNGVSFTAPGSGVTLAGFDGGSYAGFLSGTGAPATNLSTAYQNILTGGQYANGGTPCTVTLNSLTSGHQYLVQLWVNDSRNLGQNRTETLTSGTNTVTLAYPANSAGALGQYTTGTFVATSSTKVITLTGNASTQINALQLRDQGIPAVVPTPVFSPVAGIYLGGSQTVTITSSGTIYYTTDGSPPTTSSSVYSGPITVPADTTMTITAYATAPGQSDSDVASATYTTYTTPAGPTWTNAAGGSWADSGNWAHTLIASGSGVTADFSTLDLGADATVTLDGAYTIGQLLFGDTTPSNNWILDTGSTGTLTLAATGTPSISVANETTTINALLSGSQGFSKTGNGTLVLTAANNYSGTTTVNAGELDAQSKNGDVPYVVSSTATLKIGYTTGGGYANTGMQVHGNGTSAITGLYLNGGSSYNVSGQLSLLDAPTTIRQYGSGLAGMGVFDINSTGLWVSAAASGSVIDTNIQMISRGYGMSCNIDAGANTATGDLVVNGPLNVSSGTYGFYKRGAGSLVLNGAATANNSALHIENGSVICGVANCVGTNAALYMSGGTSLALKGYPQSVDSVVTGTATIKLAAPGTDILTVTNNLNITGATLELDLTGALTAPVYVIASYGTLTGTFANVANLPAGYAINYNYSGNEIALMDTSVAPHTLWTGSSSGEWDINTTSNWSLGGSATVYQDDDLVVFDDTSATQSVSLNTTVNPLYVLFSDPTKDYTLSGTGSIAGPTALTKSGAGMVTLANNNLYTGATTINAGTLKVGGALATSGIANSAALIYDIASDQTASYNITGTGSFAKTGAATLTLQGNKNFSGGVTVNNGTLLINAGGWYVNPFTQYNVVTINANGTLQTGWAHSLGVDQNAVVINGGHLLLGAENYISNLQMTGGLVSGGELRTWGGTMTFNASSTGATISSNFNLVGDATLSVADGAATDDLTISGIIYNSHGFTKTGAGRLLLTGANTYTGVTTVNGGILAVTGNSIPDAGKLVITSGVVDVTGAETVGSLFFGGTQQAPGTWGATGSGATHIDNTRFSGSGMLVVTSGPDYNAWAAANAPGQTASQDHDNDGVPNGVEYFMGLTGSGFTALPGIVDNAGVRTVTWPKGSTYYGTYGTDYVVQTSADLSTWTDAAIGTGPGYVTDGSSSVTFTLPDGDAKIFTRLKVTGP